MNKNETVIIAAFNDSAAVESAIENLREWDKRVRDVKLGVIGTVEKVEGVIKSDVVHGSLFHRSMPISDAGVTALAQELGDRIAVVVACDDYEASMVTDSLVRDGGRILVSTYERTKEEGLQEEKEVAEALNEQAAIDASDAAKRAADRNINRPV